MLDDEKHPNASTCKECGYILDFEYHNPFFKIKRKTFDFSHPYDIGHIVSLKFKEFCIRENYKGLLFKEFERQPNFFQLIVNNVVQFDTQKAKTEFGKRCKTCNNYEFTTGFEPPSLKNTSNPLDDGFYRTDILFGSYNRKNPIIVVGTETYQKLKREKMKGLIFDPITVEQ